MIADPLAADILTHLSPMRGKPRVRARDECPHCQLCCRSRSFTGAKMRTVPCRPERAAPVDRGRICHQSALPDLWQASAGRAAQGPSPTRLPRHTANSRRAATEKIRFLLRSRMHGSSQRWFGARGGADCNAPALLLRTSLAGALLGVKGLAETDGRHAGTGRRRAPETALDDALAAVAQGDRDALRTVYDLTRAKLYGIALGVLRDREAAEDVLQSVYLTIWKKAGRFDAERASPITWLATIARNRSIDRLRQRAPERHEAFEEMGTIADSAAGPDRLVGLSDDYHRLETCLDRLDETHARAVRRAFLEGETYSALAERMSVPLGTLKSWIRRSLLKLRDCLAV